MAHVFSAFLEEQLTELHMRIVEKHEELPQLSLSTHPVYQYTRCIIRTPEKSTHTHTHTHATFCVQFRILSVLAHFSFLDALNSAS